MKLTIFDKVSKFMICGFKAADFFSEMTLLDIFENS